MTCVLPVKEALKWAVSPFKIILIHHISMQTANCIGSVNSAYTVSDPKEQENAKNLSSRSLEKHFKNASSASIV